MASTINASNSGFGGIVSTGDSSGQMQLQTAGTTAVTIDTSQNATFAKNIILNGSTSGTITLAAPAVSGTTTLTLPASTGTVMVNGPAFSAYASSIQTPITSGAFTKVVFGTEDYDTNNNFASSTFTPTVAGYYQLNTSCMFTSTLVLQRRVISIYKNGSAYARLVDSSISTPSGENDITSGSIIVYANGSTDYFEVYVYVAGTGTLSLSTATSSNTSRFSGSMIRST
jgi:hypothetical protein